MGLGQARGVTERWRHRASGRTRARAEGNGGGRGRGEAADWLPAIARQQGGNSPERCAPRPRTQDAPSQAPSQAPKHAISPVDAARMEPALASARAAVPASPHADACFDCVHVGYTHGWVAAVAAEQAHLVRLRHTPEARAKLTAFLSRS